MRSDFDAEEVRRSFRHEALCLVAQVLLFPFGIWRSRHRTPRSAERRTLVLVHGLGANRSSFAPLQIYLRLAGFMPDAGRWPGLSAFTKRMHARPSFDAVIAPLKSAFGKRWVEMD